MSRYTGGLRGAGAAAVPLALLLSLAACGGGDEAAKGEEKGAAAAPAELALGTADVAVVQSSQVSGGVAVTGSLDPYQVVDVKAQVPGTVHGLRVDRGQAVSRGQVMATIEAEGIRSSAAGAQAGVAAARAQEALARRQLESARTLYQAGAMSEIDFRGAQTQYEAAQAQVAAARAQAAGAGEQARRATITAPIGGEVSRRVVNEGEAVSVGATLFTVVNTEILELAGQVPVEMAAGVRPGLPVEFTIAAYPGRVFRGEVARVEPTADPSTRQVGVYVRLANRGRELVGGQFATGRILSGGSVEQLVVPNAAIRREGDAAYVWVIENGKAVRRTVALGAQDAAAGTVGVTQGVRAGEQVIVAPGEVTDGARVRIGAAAAPQNGGENGK